MATYNVAHFKNGVFQGHAAQGVSRERGERIAKGLAEGNPSHIYVPPGQLPAHPSASYYTLQPVATEATTAASADTKKADTKESDTKPSTTKTESVGFKK